MSDTEPHLHITHGQNSLVPGTPVVPVVPKKQASSANIFTSSPVTTSHLLRLLAFLTTQCPHLFPALVGGLRGGSPLADIPWAGVVVPPLYVLSLPGWLRALNSGPRSYERLVGREEGTKLEVQEKSYAQAVKNKKGKKRIVKVEQIEEFQDAASPASLAASQERSYWSPLSWQPFAPGRSRLTSFLSLAFNTLALLCVLDQCWSPLLLKHDDVAYARVSSITPHTATINLRLPLTAPIAIPPIPEAPVAPLGNELVYRPKFVDTAAPTAWQHSRIAPASREQDWFGQIQLEGLQSGIMYDYRVKKADGEMWPSYDEAPLNFTTSPDPRLSGQSRFKFIHAGQSRTHPSPYSPFSLLSPVLIPFLPTSAPHIAPTPTHFLHVWRDYHARQPAWRLLANWLHDMRSRTAWAQIEFGLLGEDIELAGQKRWALGTSTGREDRVGRTFMGSRDARDVYETLPVLASHLHSPSEGSVLEPGAISFPESSFAYANNHFYRLRKPTLERSARDSHDWLADLSELKTWLTAVNSTSGFKFITSPVPLNPFFGGSQYETEWRTAVLDLLRFVPNTIVLSESRHGATASLLRNSVIEICSPPLSLPTTPRWWPFSADFIPDRTKATEETISTWARFDGKIVEEIDYKTVDTLLRHYPLHPTKTTPSLQSDSKVHGRPVHAQAESEYDSHAVQGRWTSLEVDTFGTQPIVKATFWRNGAQEGKFEVYGKAASKVGRLARALGGTEETGWGWLKRWGLIPSGWF